MTYRSDVLNSRFLRKIKVMTVTEFMNFSGSIYNHKRFRDSLKVACHYNMVNVQTL